MLRYLLLCTSISFPPGLCHLPEQAGTSFAVCSFLAIAIPLVMFVMNESPLPLQISYASLVGGLILRTFLLGNKFPKTRSTISFHTKLFHPTTPFNRAPFPPNKCGE
jgi:hypothetical protein